ncbi:MAG: cytochrome c biogenesis protein CcdA [Caldilineaceae bacterium]
MSLSLVSAAPLAFFAGVISFISPCVLPLVPAYIGYLSGAALNNRKA